MILCDGNPRPSIEDARDEELLERLTKGLDVLTYIIAATVNGGMRDSFEKLLIDPFAQFKVNKERFML